MQTPKKSKRKNSQQLADERRARLKAKSDLVDREMKNLGTTKSTDIEYVKKRKAAEREALRNAMKKDTKRVNKKARGK